MRILALERDGVSQRLLTLFFGKRGIKIEAAGTFDEAKKLFNDSLGTGDNYSLVLVNHLAPGTAGNPGGPELIHYIREGRFDVHEARVAASGQPSIIPIIFTSTVHHMAQKMMDGEFQHLTGIRLHCIPYTLSDLHTSILELLVQPHAPGTRYSQPAKTPVPA